MLTGSSIAIDGLNETMRGLNKIDKSLGRTVSKASRELVKQVVPPVAVAKWSSQKIKPSAASKVIKVSVTQRAAGITLRYGTYPYAAGVEFGSWRYHQFRGWRGNQHTVSFGASTGYVVQDSIKQTLPIVEKRWTQTIADAIDKAVQNG